MEGGPGQVALSTAPTGPRRSGGGLNGAVEAPVRLLEADVVGQLIAVGVQLAHLALGLQWVPGGCRSVDAAGDGRGHAGSVGRVPTSWRGKRHPEKGPAGRTPPQKMGFHRIARLGNTSYLS